MTKPKNKGYEMLDQRPDSKEKGNKVFKLVKTRKRRTKTWKMYDTLRMRKARSS